MRVIWDVCSGFYRLSVAVVWNLHSREAVAVRVKLSFTPPVCKPGLRSGGLEAISSHQGCDILNSHDYVSAPIAVPALDASDRAVYACTARALPVARSVPPHSNRLKSILLLSGSRSNVCAADVVRGDFSDRVEHLPPQPKAVGFFTMLKPFCNQALRASERVPPGARRFNAVSNTSTLTQGRCNGGNLWVQWCRFAGRYHRR